MDEKKITIPIGPGRGEAKTMQQALYALMAEMRGHIRDLSDIGEADQAEVLGRYAAALWLIYHQAYQSQLYGLGLPNEMVKQAIKYRLDLPVKEVE